MITVLTPAYNRAYTLSRLYHSLLSQTDKGFEWVVIDDGSGDETREMIAKWREESLFPIIYQYQENRGKMLALNEGVKLSGGQYIFIVDSDDALTEDAIETINLDINENDGEKGLIYRRASWTGEIIGRETQEQKLILHPTEAGKKLRGDLAYIFPKRMMEKYPFPEIKEEKFVPELYIWNKIGDEEPFVCYPQKVIYLCEYLEDGYSKNFDKTFRENPKGFLLFYKDQFFRETSLSGRAKILIRIIQGYSYGVLKYFWRRDAKKQDCT